MTKSLICATVTAATTAELRRRRDEVVDADLVELRLDSVSDPNVAGALAERRRPVIVTCRPTWEGGRFAGSEEERKKLLAEALSLGAEYVDLEWRAHFDDLIAQTEGRRIVLSMHDFDGTPPNLAALAQDLRDALEKTEPGRVVEPFFSPAGLEVIMRCDTPAVKPVAFELPSREELEQQLFVQQMSVFAKSYLRDLRRNAVVETR